MDARAQLTAALRLDRGIRGRAAAEVRPIPEGVVIRHPELFDVHYLNAVLLDAGAAVAPDDVPAVADRLGDAGHRHVVFDEADTGERAAALLAAEGWERRRMLYMAFGGDPDALGADPRARRISAEELDALQVAAVREQLPDLAARRGLAARLVASQEAVRRASAETICFGAGEGDGLQSTCTLLLDDGAALLTEVVTLESHRQRGLARAVVAAAVRCARVRGASLIAVCTDADDWPQLMYSRLGFQPLGRQVSLTLRRGGSVRGGL